MAALFVAQALNIELSRGQQLTMLGVAMLTSKGASGVTGAGFITLAATLAVVFEHPRRRFGFDSGHRSFMSEARALTNLSQWCRHSSSLTLGKGAQPREHETRIAVKLCYQLHRAPD